MEKILFFINKVPIETIIHDFKKSRNVKIISETSRELLVRREKPQNSHLEEYLFCFSKTMSETLLKLRKKYFNMVLIDERSGSPNNLSTDFNNLLYPFLEKVEREPNIDKKYSLNRIMVLIDSSPHLSEITFELGRRQIGSYVADPFTHSHLIDKINEVLHEKRKTGKMAICIAGGGLEGLLYELGVLRALNSLFKNVQVTDFDMYCGISSGAFISSILANGIQPEEFIKAFEGESETFDHITSQTIYDLNFNGYFTRLLSFWMTMAKFTKNHSNIFSSVIKAFPNGICKGEKLRQFLKKQLTSRGFSDDFRKLQKELYIGATNMDTFQHVIFGDEGWRDVPISTAVRASAAMEPIYTPYKIGNSWYIDGAFTKTTNFEFAIRKGATLVIIVDPVIPIKTSQTGYVHKKGGIFSTIQGLKGLISSRFDRTYAYAKKQHQEVDFYVFKPRGEDMRLLSGSPMKYNIRLGIVALAYKNTIKRIMDDYEIFSKGFAKYGIELTRQVVEEEGEKMKSGDINTIKAILENSSEYKKTHLKKDKTFNGGISQFKLGLFD